MAEPHAFDDADDLDASGVSDAELASTLASLVRADVSGVRPGAVKSAVDAASPKDRPRLLLVLADAIRDAALADWIDADPARRRRAAAIAKAVAPPEPEASHNAAVLACFQAFGDWERFEYRLLVVPGYTPLDEKQARPGVHPVTQRRLERAVQEHRGGAAPFFLVSGANVYPRGTPYFEAVEMKNALRALGVAAERILVEARARHTTTNLRNAGRIMRRLGVAKALVITKGGGMAGSDVFGQDFYLAHPDLSTFHGRCRHELGYEIGELRGVGDGRIEFEPSPDVDAPGYDPLDP